MFIMTGIMSSHFSREFSTFEVVFSLSIGRCRLSVNSEVSSSVIFESHRRVKSAYDTSTKNRKEGVGVVLSLQQNIL